MMAKKIAQTKHVRFGQCVTKNPTKPNITNGRRTELQRVEEELTIM